MTVRIIEATEEIPVTQLCCLIYGQPGSRKTSLAQTAEDPFTFAFDPGIYRAFGRKQCGAFSTWSDVVAFSPPGKTVVVDTVGMCLEKLSSALIHENPKNGNRLGGLSLPGYGCLKTQFAAWVSKIREAGRDLIFIAHEKIEGNGDDRYAYPDITGGSYNTLMNVCDLVGYLHFDGGKRVLDFSPTDRWMAKSPPCSWPRLELPDFGQKPHFLAELLAEGKASMGRVSGESAKVAALVDGWCARLGEIGGDLASFNAAVPEIGSLANGVKHQIWALIIGHAKTFAWTWDKPSKAFLPTTQEVPA